MATLNTVIRCFVALVVFVTSIVFAQNVGIGTANPASKLSVAGNLSVGSAYVGTAAPANGAIIQGPVGIGTATPHASAILDVNATDKGFLLPRLTTAQRNSIASPENSLLIFNTDVGCYQGYNAAASVWEDIYCFSCISAPSAPTANAATGISTTDFTANWSSVAGATTYYLDVATDVGFTSFVPGYNNLNVGSVTSYNVAGLSCNTTYYYRVRAGNACGTSPNSNSISVTTGGCPFRCLAIGGGNDDFGNSIIQTTDGGYAVAGSTFSFGAGGRDFYVVKLDVTGNVQWTRTIGGGSNDYGNLISIIQTSDGGYAVAGVTYSFGAGSSDVYVVKLNGSGNIQWTRTIGGGYTDSGYSIIQTTDGGYAVAGYTNSFSIGDYDVYVVKLNSSGNIQWTRVIQGFYNEEARSIIQTTDGGYVVAGFTQSFGAGSSDVYVVKLNGSGNIQWTRTIGGVNGDGGNSIIQTSDGGYAVAGGTSSFGSGNSDVYVVKLDANGNMSSCPGGCQVSSGGTAGSGGNASSGGTAGSGGNASSGGNAGLGGTLINLCP
jgi:hypothetical protein